MSTYTQNDADQRKKDKDKENEIWMKDKESKGSRTGSDNFNERHQTDEGSAGDGSMMVEESEGDEEQNGSEGASGSSLSSGQGRGNMTVEEADRKGGQSRGSSGSSKEGQSSSSSGSTKR